MDGGSDGRTDRLAFRGASTEGLINRRGDQRGWLESLKYEFDQI